MWICSHLRLLLTVIFLTTLYYADILSDFAVLLNYYRAHENGFFAITSCAMACSLLAQILYSPLLSIYRDRTSPMSTLSCTLRLLLSALYVTPFYLLYKFLVLQCCRLAKGSRDELQLAKMSESDNNVHSMDIAMLHHIPMIDEQQRPDPQMIDGSLIAAGVLTESVKLHLLQNLVDDLVRYSLLKSCFQSSVHVFVQAVVLGEYYLFSDETRRSQRDDIALSTNDVLLFPDTVDEVYLLNISCIISFVSLCTASWSQIAGVLRSSPVLERNICIPSLFVLRAILESTLRVLRFMAVAVVFGALYGVIVMVLEMTWKAVVLSRCDRKRKRARIRRREDRKRKSSGYSGPIKVDRDGKQLVVDQAAYSPMASGSNPIGGGGSGGGRCRCDLALWKGTASWMLFSRERFEYIPYLMRSTDIVLWTVLLVGGTCVAEQVTVSKIDLVCPHFLQFQSDCIPLELIITMAAAILLLLVIYAVCPSIFSLVSSLDQDIPESGRSAKLLNGGGMRIEDWREDEYDSEEDHGVTVIDISQSEQTAPSKPKRKYSKPNNLMLMSVDDEVDHDQSQFDYQQSNQ